MALLIGIAVGTYSSMFTATPLAVELEKHSTLPPPLPKRDPARTRPRGPRPTRPRDDSGAVL
ncbi:MAG: hypothetical protein ACRDN9_20485 [Streptosporangiaceae bacterium]